MKLRYTFAIFGLLATAASAQPITQPFGGTFWGVPGGTPSNVNRFADRLFIGPAVYESGLCQLCTTSHDWFEALQSNSYNGGPPIYSDGPFAQTYILADPNSASALSAAPNVALVVGAETLNSPNGSSVRAQDLTVVNNAVSGQNPPAWGQYIEAHAVGTSHGTTYASEIEARNSSGQTHWDPFNAPTAAGNTVDLQLGCGAGLPITGQFNCTAALGIGGNPAKFETGILFFPNTIAPNGPGFTIPAIAMPHDYQIQWYTGPGSLGAAITGDATGGLHIQAGRLYVPGGVTWTSPPYGVPAYYACFDTNFTLVVSVGKCN